MPILPPMTSSRSSKNSWVCDEISRPRGRAVSLCLSPNGKRLKKISPLLSGFFHDRRLFSRT